MLGDDVPDGLACFQRRTGDPLCFGRAGGTTIKIKDNDGKTCVVSIVDFQEASCILGSSYRAVF